MSQYEPAPAGETSVEIVAASIGDVAWKASQDNPRGECLRLRLSAGRDYGFIFTDVPMDWGRMLKAVGHAAGVEGEELLPESFVGRQARVVLKHYVGKDGTTRASVAKWLPARVTVEAPRGDQSPTLVDAIKAWERQPASTSTPAPAAKPSRNAPPQYGADDDIPF